MRSQLRNQKHLSLFGLKFNPFSPEAPTGAFWSSPGIEHFCWRVEHLTREGGFALITGDPGTGKSVALRLLVARLEALPDIEPRVLTRPQSSLADFYRELGDLFGVELSPHNRWAGAKILRQRWLDHIEATLSHAVLIIDEAQEMVPKVLNELRLLCASKLDSRALLTVVLAGDQRLSEKFRSPELLPVGSRIRVRCGLEHASPEQLAECLRHLLAEAGNRKLMTSELVATLSEHAAGNLRVLMTMANELLDAAIQKEAEQIDEQLFLEIFATPAANGRSAKAKTSRSRER